ncbi:hypothetical protein GCM10010429_24880 [Micromonospora olivasterospora]|uniref:Uncharacterized protein n=1 Tax=Micromonospora olivasterospora TaxID=1880 RepID=A0A562IBM4_MICOL|nr:hypothetical protein JD77_03093 [Micromonospora olivasterospora]
MGHSTVESGEGGRTSSEMAGHVERATVTAWEPGKRFAYATDAGPDGAVMAIGNSAAGRDPRGVPGTVQLVGGQMPPHPVSRACR